MQRSKSLEDLPNEVIQLIFQHLGPTRCTLADRCNFYPLENIRNRQDDRRHALQTLRLTNKRLSNLAQLQQYRDPHDMMRSKAGLSSDHIDIIVKLLYRDDSSVVSLVGTSLFFAGLLQSGFKRLTWLRLHFSVPPLQHTDWQIAPGEECKEESWILGLRETIRLIPLKYLEISFMEPEAFHHHDRRTLSARGMLLAAGHPTLETLAFEGHAWDTYYDPEEKEAIMHGRSVSTSLTSLQVHRLTGQQFKMLFRALGELPALSNLTILWPKQPPSLARVPVKVALSILHLRLAEPAMSNGGSISHLPRFHNLTSLQIAMGSGDGSLQEEMTKNVYLPNLRSIMSTSVNAFQTNASILAWATRRLLLPMLTNIVLSIRIPVTSSSSSALLEQMVAKYADVKAARPEIDVSPGNLQILTVEASVPLS